MPLQPGDITDVRITQTSQTGENGELLRFRTVSYRVRKQGPFAISVRADQFSAEAAERLIRQEAAQLVAIMEIS